MLGHMIILGNHPAEHCECSWIILIKNDVKGNIDVKEDGLLFTSIPFDKGWAVKVDGKKVETKAIKDGFLGIELKSGTHKLEFSYFPQGLKPGLFISSISILILLVAFILSKKSEKERKAHIRNRKRRIPSDTTNINPPKEDAISQDIPVEEINNDITFEDGFTKNQEDVSMDDTKESTEIETDESANENVNSSTDK